MGVLGAEPPIKEIQYCTVLQYHRLATFDKVDDDVEWSFWNDLKRDEMDRGPGWGVWGVEPLIRKYSIVCKGSFFRYQFAN